MGVSVLMTLATLCISVCLHTTVRARDSSYFQLSYLLTDDDLWFRSSHSSSCSFSPGGMNVHFGNSTEEGRVQSSFEEKIGFGACLLDSFCASFPSSFAKLSCCKHEFGLMGIERFPGEWTWI